MVSTGVASNSINFLGLVPAVKMVPGQGRLSASLTGALPLDSVPVSMAADQNPCFCKLIDRLYRAAPVPSLVFITDRLIVGRRVRVILHRRQRRRFSRARTLRSDRHRRLTR